MKRKPVIFPWVVALVLAAAIILGVRYFQHQRVVQQQNIAVAPAAGGSAAPTGGVAAPSTAPTPRFPIADVTTSIPAPAGSAALPPLDQSDSTVTSQMSHLLGSDALSKFLASSHLIQRFVATIDALPRHKADRRVFPLKPPAKPFTVTRAGEHLQLDAGDFARYDMYMAWISQADIAQWVAWYKQTYPLFQVAYRQLGYPDGFFNDRLVAVIDNLLAAPDPKGPIRIKQTDTGYIFADPALESLSVGQKLMVRVGPVNEKVLKHKLRVLRTALAGGKEKSAAGEIDKSTGSITSG